MGRKKKNKHQSLNEEFVASFSNLQIESDNVAPPLNNEDKLNSVNFEVLCPFPKELVESIKHDPLLLACERWKIESYELLLNWCQQQENQSKYYRMGMSMEDMKKFKVQTNSILKIKIKFEDNTFQMNQHVFVWVWPNLKLSQGQVCLNSLYYLWLIQYGGGIEDLTIKADAGVAAKKSAHKVVLHQIYKNADINSCTGHNLVLEISTLFHQLKYVWLGQMIPLFLSDITALFEIRQISSESETVSMDNSNYSSIFNVCHSIKIRWSIENEKKASGQYNVYPFQKIDGATFVGMTEQKNSLQKMIQSFIPSEEWTNETERRHSSNSIGIILHGASGCGKTLMAHYLAETTHYFIVSIKCEDLFHQDSGTHSKASKMKMVIEEIYQQAPCLVLIENLDQLSGDKKDAAVSQCQRLMRSLKEFPMHIKTIVIGTARKYEGIAGNLVKCGYFDYEVELPSPTDLDRQNILHYWILMCQRNSRISGAEICQLSQRTYGYVGGDLVQVVKEAALEAINESIQKSLLEPDMRDEVCLSYEHLLLALSKVVPRARKSFVLEIPRVLWSDIGGQEEIKQTLKEVIEWPLLHPHIFQHFSMSPPRGVLLYGPPGCSKTMLAKAVATEAHLNFVSVKGPELFSKFVGDSEKALRAVFQQARAASPSIIFFDEIDALGSARGQSTDGTSVGDRMLSQLLSEMDGMEPLVHVTILGATNRPDILDPALLRPGRFDRLIFISPPDVKARSDILRIKLRATPLASDVDFDILAHETAGFSGAELQHLCHLASFKAMERCRDVQQVMLNDFMMAIKDIPLHITPAMMDFYEAFKERTVL